MRKPRTPKHSLKMPIRDGLRWALYYARIYADTSNKAQLQLCREFIRKYWSARNTGLVLINR